MTSNNPSKRVLEICDHVLPLKREQRDAYLDRVCRGNRQTRQQVESLLDAIDDSGSFLIIDDPNESHND